MSLGTQAYLLQLNLAASEHQTTLIQQFKSRGDDVIQTGSGLCVKSSMSAGEIEAFVCETACDGIKIETVRPDTELAPDIKAFLGR